VLHGQVPGRAADDHLNGGRNMTNGCRRSGFSVYPVLDSGVQDDHQLTAKPDPAQAPSLQPQDVRPWPVWRRFGLREYLALVLMLVALLPLLTLYWAERHQIQADALDLTRQTLNLIADVQQRRINLELRRLEDLTRLVSSRTQMRLSLAAHARDGDPKHLELITRILTDAIGSIPELRGIWIRDSSGRALIQVTRDGALANALDLADIPVAAPAPILFRRLETQKPEIWLNGPLVLDEAVIGSVHLLVRMENIRALLEDFDNQYPGGETVLRLRGDTGGTFAWNARAGVWNLDTAPAGPLNDLLRNLPRPAAPKSASGRSGGVAIHAPLIHTARALTLDGSHILVHTDGNKITQGADKQRELLVYVTLSLILLALGTAVILARVIADPIHELKDGMRRLSQGDYYTRIPEHGWGELLRLTQAFNETAESLQRAIQARLRSERELATLANTDALTGLNNRRRFMELLTQHFDRTRHPANTGALLYLDLDGFKPINDHYGHDAGDAVLRIVAERLRRVVREQDHLGRLGGDEFAVLLNRLEAGFEPESVARRIRETLSQPMTIQGQQLQIGCSLGWVPIASDSQPSRLLKEADAAMYRDKTGKSGRT
jgi:diguanylate cyclase (GGDEF)-like protein